MPPNSGQFWLPPHERFASQLRHLANQDLFSQNKRFAKEYSQKALQIFREGEFKPEIQVGVSTSDGLDFVLLFADGARVSVAIQGGPGRVFQFDQQSCDCAVFAEHQECPPHCRRLLDDLGHRPKSRPPRSEIRIHRRQSRQPFFSSKKRFTIKSSRKRRPIPKRLPF